MNKKLKVGIVGLGGILTNAHMIGYNMLKDKGASRHRPAGK